MTKNINRRHFIGSSALAAGATLLAPSMIKALGVDALGIGAALGIPAAQQPLSSYDGKARELVAQMTLEEKIGQMTQAEQDALKDVNDIQKFSLGSLLSGGGSDPKAGNSLAELERVKKGDSSIELRLSGRAARGREMHGAELFTGRCRVLVLLRPGRRRQDERDRNKAAEFSCRHHCLLEPATEKARRGSLLPGLSITIYNSELRMNS